MDKYISIKQVLDDLLDHPLLKDLSLERAINYTIHFSRIVGMPRIFNDKTEVISIIDYKGKLPCDFDSIIQVRLIDSCNNKSIKNTPIFRHTTDSFHMSNIKQDSYDFTYKLQGNFIFTSIKEGEIELAYRAIAVDSEGFPLIPDDSSFIRALELYIKKQVFTILFDLGQLNPSIYNNILQEYAWAVGQAQSSMVKPTIDQMESLSNMLNTLIPRVREHRYGFINTGSRELIKDQ